MFYLICRHLHMLQLASLSPLLKLCFCERLVGYELGPEHPLLFPVPHPQPDVGPAFHHVVDLGRLADVCDLGNPVHRNILLFVVANSDPGKTADNSLFEDGQVNKLVNLEPGETDLFQLGPGVDDSRLFHNLV